MNGIGWISLHRKLQKHWLWTESRVYSKAEAWIDILLRSNPVEAKMKKKTDVIKIGRGETVTTLGDLAFQWDWNKSKVRRFLKILEDDKMIEVSSDQSNTIISICKYDHYQSQGDAIVDEKKKPIEERKSDFKELLVPFLDKFGKIILNEFYQYWTEHGPKDIKMRWEKEKSFGISRRLATWKKNKTKFKGPEQNNTTDNIRLV
jgi:hypothetical protein